MQKKICFFLMGLLLLCGNVNAQRAEKFSSLSFGVLYDYQIANGNFFQFRESTNIGMRLMIEAGINELLSYRVHGTINGFLVSKSDGEIRYDRRAIAGADIVFGISNLFDINKAGVIFGALGGGIVYGANSKGLLSFCANVGVGYTYWFKRSSSFGVYFEQGLSYFSGVDEFTTSTVIGVRKKF